MRAPSLEEQLDKMSPKLSEVPKPNPYIPAVEAGARLSHDGTRLCWRATDRVWRMYDTATGALCWQWKCPSEDFLKIGNSDPEITFVGKGQFVAITKLPTKFPFVTHRLLRVADGTLVPEDAPEAHLANIRPPSRWRSSMFESFSPDGRRCLRRSIPDGMHSDGWSLLDLITGRQIAFIPKTWEPRGSCFSPDSQRIATADYSGCVGIHDAADGRLLQTQHLAMQCRWVEFSDDGEMLLVVDRRFQVRLCRRQRFEYWWGLAWLPEFWLTILFAAGLVWSVWRDRRQLNRG